jgi:hypothetical protein
MNKNFLAFLAVAAVSTIAVRAEDNKGAAATVPATYPVTVFKASPELDRFADPAYYRMLAADGLRSSDPKAVYERMVAAARAREGYKALYLSRIFTELEPANQTGWTNRAQLASALGFEAEAAAARANASIGTAARLSGGALPGVFQVRPETLADWAAAVALAADDTFAREGRQMVLAVRDDLSGVQVPATEEVQRQARGPWVTAKPVQLHDVLSNVFAMPSATPMDKKSMKGGMFALGIVTMAGSAYSQFSGVAESAATLSELSGNAMAKAFEVASDFKDGSFVSVTYVNGTPRSTTLKPKTAGKHEAIGTPVPMLWASGPSLSPAVQALWSNGDTSKSEAIRIDGKTTKQEWKKYELKPLMYPKVQQLCDRRDRCSSRLTILEVMLSADDLRALAPATASRLPNISTWSSQYGLGDHLTVAAAGERYTGFDASGVTYVTRQRPTEWLVTASAASKK